MLSRIFNFIFSIFQFVFLFFFTIIQSLQNIVRPSLPPSSPQEDVDKFLQELHNKLPNTEVLPFINDSYAEAMKMAKKEFSFLTIYLNDWKMRGIQQYIDMVLCNNGIVECLLSNSMLWACDINTLEGYRVSAALKARTFPFLAVIGIREGQQLVLSRMPGIITVENALEVLNRVYALNAEDLLLSRRIQEERAFNQQLRRQQDEDYAESLRMDRERELVRNHNEKLVVNHQESQQQKDQNLLLLKSQFEFKLNTEPNSSIEETVNIQFRLPSGKRLERRFNIMDPLLQIYIYLLLNELCPDEFEVQMGFPRKTIPCNPGDDQCNNTFKDFGFSKSESLYVTDLNA